MRMVLEDSLVMVVDLQARLLPVIEGGEQAVTEAVWLGRLATELEVPVWLTEQYPEGLGHSDPRLLEALPDACCWQKSHFGALDEVPLAEALAASGRRQIVLCGTEAHICVLQTALGLREAGYAVFWLDEATVSRRRDEARLARQRAVQAGAVVVSADMVAYEWLGRCDDERFKGIHRRFLRERASRPLSFS
ncbi:Isochorismatase family protein [Franzmannia pantelleriensis]|uniref:Isochorismatase family protein n=1 Tax=Franzmannia pantelleriensis TaxID=48727 RepID=A0A1G9QQR1_9GAMM|nr:isochorismatase family protein [Halomonas pantelleriensis]SDM12897.1 Isochorismatase family protein [Halomonas pantelleriensis]